MRIAFDGSTLTPRRTGVGYYTDHLLSHLAAEVAATGDELIVIAHRPIDTTVPLPPHVQVRVGPWFPVRLGWLQLMAGRVLATSAPTWRTSPTAWCRSGARCRRWSRFTT